MPFTFAHPAAVLPLHRAWPRRFVLSALVVGSMSPDFAYLFPWWVGRADSHSLAGSLVFCVPVSAVTYVIFHRLLKAPLASLLPDRFAALANLEMERTPRLPAHPPLGVAVSLWIGALTHMAWDAFTHPGGPMLETFPLLTQVVMVVEGVPIQAYRFLQHLSTVGGFLAILAAVWSRSSHLAPLSRPARGRRARTVAVLLAVPTLAVVLARLDRWLAVRSIRDGHDILFLTVISGLSAFALTLLVFAAGWHLGRRFDDTGRSPSSS